jgi:E3 ubiquitin-protein ligase HUWE1
MNNNRNHRPIVVRNATRLHQGDMPPAAFVVQIIGILAALIQKSRSVAMCLLVLPSDHLPLANGAEAKHLPMDAKESDEDGPCAAFMFRELSPREHELLGNLPFARLLQLLESRTDAPEIADAVESVLSPLVQTMNTLESESGCVSQERLEARLPPLVESPTAPVIQHPQHPHPIQWADTFVDPRYQSRPFQCNLCRVTSHFWGYRCAACHFDLCPACALDRVNATTQKARMSRWGYWVVASTPLLSLCASILSRNACKERTAVRLVCLLSRGIRLCGHNSAPNDEALCELESILCKHAKDLMCGIREAVRRIEDIQLALRHIGQAAAPTTPPASECAPSSAAAPTAQQQSLLDVAAIARKKDLPISKALMLMELPEEMMRNVYLLFLPYAETQRSQLRPEIRLMFHASRVYLLEISNLLSQHPNRLRAVLPAAAFPLLNGYAQFHMLYGTGDGTESISMAERSETERLLSEKQTEVSAVSEVAWTSVVAARRAATANERSRGGDQQRDEPTEEEREALPHHIYKFCEANRTLINTLIHWDPTLLDEGLKFITRAPRLVDLDFKLKNFRKTFQRSRQRTQQHSITINRMNCFQDSFKAIKDLPEPCPIHVRFQQEEGSDAGGLVREWFQILGEEMVNDNYALFVHSSEGMTYQPNPCSGVNANHLEYFRFCGMVVGLAVYNDISMDVHFTRSVYRHMIGAEPCFRDVETMDPTMYTNLEKLLSLDIAPEMNLDFTVTFERFGKTEEAELIPNGANILVTNDNKKEYIRLRSAFIMTQQIEAQLREFLIGFYKMVPRKEVQTFTEQELELVISGLPDIDVEDLRLNTEYNGYGPSSPVIRWFWEIVSSMTRQDRANLLQFATGSSKVPLGGFANLESGGNRHRFSITKTDSPIELLPSAHTCFNRIDIPEYTTADMLREKLMIAITYGNKGFTMV